MNEIAATPKRGRPKGSTKAAEDKKQRLSLRIIPEVHEIIRQHAGTDSFRSKTEFVETAIIQYHEQLLSGQSGEPAEPPAEGASAAAQYAEVLERETGQLEKDFVDHIVDQWNALVPVLNRPGRPISFQIYARIQRIGHLLNWINDRKVLPHGLKRIEFLLLATLVRSRAPMRASMLNRELLVSPGAITKFVDRLESLGYVKRIADKEDRRAIRIAITEKGLNLYLKISELSGKNNLDPWHPVQLLDEHEQYILSQLLRKLLNITQKRIEELKRDFKDD